MAAAASATMSAFLPAPSGYVVDFENPQRRGLPLAYWLTGVGLVFATLAIAMRIYTRTRIVKDFRAEDWCIVASFLFSVAVQSITLRTYVVKSGAVHAWEMPVSKFNYEAVMITIAANLYVICLALAKASLLAFYYRMSQLRWLRIISVFIGAVIVAYSLALILALVFACSPIKKAWDVTITEGTCINRPAVYVLLAVLNIATDVMLLIIPVPMVWKLQMPLVQKVGVVVVFLIGSATCLTSIVRLVLLLDILGDPDQPWAVAIPSMWVNIEANLVIICCSLPALRLFMRHFAPRWMGESFSRSRTGQSGHGTGSVTGQLKERSSRTNSGYGRMDYDDTEPAYPLPTYTLDQDPPSKGWSESRCEYVGRQSHRRSSMSHLEDATTTNSSTSEIGQAVTTNNRQRDADDNRIFKMEAFSVTSEQRVV